MEDTEPTFSSDRVKHLEMIQAVIGRLGNDSFLVKGWAVTATGVFLGFAVSGREPLLALVSIGAALMFWLLDAYYLRSERLFRVLYNRTRLGATNYEPYNMDATSAAFIESIDGDDRDKASFPKTFWRPTLRWLYLALIAAAAAVALITSAMDKSETSHCSEHYPHCVGHAGERR